MAVNYSKLIRLMVGFFLVTASSFLIAGECRVNTEYFVDTTGQLPPSEAFNRQFQSFQGVLSNGYTNSTIWIKVDAAECNKFQSIGSGDWVVRIRPTYLDLISLYLPSKNGNQPVAYTGDKKALSTGSYHSINLGFQIPAAEVAEPFFLQVRTESSNTLKLEVVTKAEAEAMDLKQAYLNGLMLTLLTLFMLWAFLQLLLDRDQFSFVFAWQQAIVLLHGLFILGYGRYYFSNLLGGDFVDITTSTLVLLYIGSRLLIEFFLFRLVMPPKIYVRCFYAIGLIWLLGVLIFIFYSERIGLMLNVSIGLVGIFACLILTILCPELPRKDGDIVLPKMLMVGYFTLMSLLSSAFALPMLGITASVKWIVDFPTALGIVSSSLIVLTVIIRRRYIEENSKKLATKLLLSQERANFEQEKREEQANMLAVLMHEVKNPLAVAKLNLGLARGSERSHARLGRAIDNIDAIVDQCGLSLQFEEELIMPLIKPCNVMRLIGGVIDDSPHRQRFQVDVASSVEIETDQHLLKIIVINLLDNANKYALPESLIAVHLSWTSGGGMKLTIGNQIGMQQSVDPEKIFRKFYREKSTGSQSGSGLGLYICSNIAKALNLRLSVVVSRGYIEFILCSLN